MSILVQGLALGAIYGLLAIGLVLVFKATRVINFAQGEFGTIGAYLAWFLIMRAHLPWGVGLLISAALVGGIGYLWERFVIRRMLDGPKLTMAVATLGLMILLGFIGIRFGPRILRQPFAGRGPELFGTLIPPARLLAIAMAIVVGGGLYLFMKRTTFGLGLLAAAQDPIAVRLMGIRLRHLSAFTWIVAAASGGLAGVLIVTSLGGDIRPFAVTTIFVQALAAALLGGMTSIPGAFAGGILVGVIQVFLGTTLSGVPGIQDAGVFVILLATLLLRPQGLFGRAA